MSRSETQMPSRTEACTSCKCVIHEPVDPNRICPAHYVMGTIWRWLVVCNGNHWQIFNEISKTLSGRELNNSVISRREDEDLTDDEHDRKSDTWRGLRLITAGEILISNHYKSHSLISLYSLKLLIA